MAWIDIEQSKETVPLSREEMQRAQEKVRKRQEGRTVKTWDIFDIQRRRPREKK